MLLEYDHYLPKLTQYNTWIHQQCQTGQSFPWPCGILQEIHQRICKGSQTTHFTHQAADKIWMDTWTSSSIYTFEGCHHPGTHFTLPKPQQNLHHIHWHFWWCLWCTTLSRTWGNSVSHSIFIAHFFWNTMQMEHYQTRSFWCVLHNNQMDLLSPGSQYNCQKWLQTTSLISK